MLSNLPWWSLHSLSMGAISIYSNLWALPKGLQFINRYMMHFDIKISCEGGQLRKRSKNSPSVQFSRSVMSNSLQPHESQHARPPCPSPTPGVYPNSCPSSQCCHPTISSSVVPFSCPQSFPASRCFQMSQLFASGGPSIRVSASTSVLPMYTQDWSSLGWTGWISLLSKGLSRVFSNPTVQKHQLFCTQLSL